MSSITKVQTNNFITGSANVDQKIIEQTVVSLIEYLRVRYLSYLDLAPTRMNDMMNEAFAVYNFPNGSMEIPVSNEERYYVQWRVDSPNSFTLENDNPLNPLLESLIKKCSELGYKAIQSITIRFEKGCFHSIAEHWHRDSGVNVGWNALTTSYSNKENWSTHFSDDSDIPWTDFKTIESRAKPLICGDFIDPVEIIHRSPWLSDLNDQNISANDYRLFFKIAAIKNPSKDQSEASAR